MTVRANVRVVIYGCTRIYYGVLADSSAALNHDAGHDLCSFANEDVLRDDRRRMYDAKKSKTSTPKVLKHRSPFTCVADAADAIDKIYVCGIACKNLFIGHRGRPGNAIACV